jgi:hypothetical protein
MQTFLPYASFEESARCLDSKRLGKQRVEVLQIVRAIGGYTKGWQSHPAVIMWWKNVPALIHYGFAICDEWVRRGFKDTCRAKLAEYLTTTEIVMPSWFGNERFHASHRAKLLLKNRFFYSYYGWKEHPSLPYIWPIPESTDAKPEVPVPDIARPVEEVEAGLLHPVLS